MAAVSASRSSSPPRNQLLAAMSATDLALLRPHLRPVALELLKDLDRPNRRIETVYFMEAGIASVVAVQPDETRSRNRSHRSRGHERNCRSAGRRPIAAFHLHAGRRQRAEIAAKDLLKAMDASVPLRNLVLKFVQAF